MPVSLLVRNPKEWPNLDEPVVATLGNLDGVHLGHQALCAGVVRARERMAKAKGAKGSTVAITFYPHPSQVLGKSSTVTALCSTRQKLELLGECGIEHLVLLRFTKQFAAVRARDFIQEILLQRLRVQHLVIGPDAHVGFRREGTPEMIVSAFAAAGRSAEILPFVQHADQRISSRRVRELLEGGDLPGLASLLGRSYSVEGRVSRGDGRGKSIGFPTANIATNDLLLPRFGVYGGHLQFFSENSPQPSASHLAVCNIGIRPTFNGSRPTVEAYLPGYQGADFYGSRVRLVLELFIRGEQKFDGIAALKQQIARDVTFARSSLLEVAR